MKPVVGTAVSNKAYNRYVKRTSKFIAHDEKDECNIGDRSSSGRKIDRRRKTSSHNHNRGDFFPSVLALVKNCLVLVAGGKWQVSPGICRGARKLAWTAQLLKKELKLEAVEVRF